MRVLILCEGKTGSTALLEGVAHALSLQHKIMEPPDMMIIPIPDGSVLKKVIEAYSEKEAHRFSLFDKRIFLVRDPRDSLVSRVLYMPYRKEGFDRDEALSSYLDLIRVKITDPGAVQFRDVIGAFDEIVGSNLLGLIGRLHQKTLDLFREVKDDFFLFHYEDFVSGNCTDFNRYIGGTLPPDIRIDGNFARVARSKSSGEWKHWMTRADCAFFNNFFADYFKMFGYVPDDPHPQPEIAPELSVDYVVRVVNDGRSRRKIPLYEMVTTHGEGS